MQNLRDQQAAVALEQLSTSVAVSIEPCDILGIVDRDISQDLLKR